MFSPWKYYIENSLAMCKKKYDRLKVYNFPMVLPVKGLFSRNNDIFFEAQITWDSISIPIF